MRFTIFIILLLVGVQLKGQDVHTKLYGFELGQFREATYGEYGSPSTKHKDTEAYEYEIFHLKKDSGLDIVFEYAPKDEQLIESIQVLGKDTSAILGFKDLKLGMDSALVKKSIGTPTYRESIDGYIHWEYDGANYEVEMNAEGKLWGVKITDNYSWHAPDVSMVPDFDDIVKILTSGDNAEIASILSPDIELHYKNKLTFIGKSFDSEIKNDDSKVFYTIKKMAIGLEKVNSADPEIFSQNMHLTLGYHPAHHMSIHKGHMIKELVFKYVNGKYLIWEIKT